MAGIGHRRPAHALDPSWPSSASERRHGCSSSAAEPLWQDEAFSWRWAHLPLSRIWGDAAPLRVQPAPVLLVFSGSGLRFGDGELTLRLLPAVFGTPDAYRSSSRCGRATAGRHGRARGGGPGRRPRPPLIAYSQEYRTYALPLLRRRCRSARVDALSAHLDGTPTLARTPDPADATATGTAAAGAGGLHDGRNRAGRCTRTTQPRSCHVIANLVRRGLVAHPCTPVARVRRMVDRRQSGPVPAVAVVGARDAGAGGRSRGQVQLSAPGGVFRAVSDSSPSTASSICRWRSPSSCSCRSPPSPHSASGPGVGSLTPLLVSPSSVPLLVFAVSWLIRPIWDQRVLVWSLPLGLVLVAVGLCAIRRAWLRNLVAGLFLRRRQPTSPPTTPSRRRMPGTGWSTDIAAALARPGDAFVLYPFTTTQLLCLLRCGGPDLPGERLHPAAPGAARRLSARRASSANVRPVGRRRRLAGDLACGRARGSGSVTARPRKPRRRTVASAAAMLVLGRRSRTRRSYDAVPAPRSRGVQIGSRASGSAHPAQKWRQPTRSSASGRPSASTTCTAPPGSMLPIRVRPRSSVARQPLDLRRAGRRRGEQQLVVVAAGEGRLAGAGNAAGDRRQGQQRGVDRRRHAGGLRRCGRDRRPARPRRRWRRWRCRAATGPAPGAGAACGSGRPGPAPRPRSPRGRAARAGRAPNRRACRTPRCRRRTCAPDRNSACPLGTRPRMVSESVSGPWVEVVSPPSRWQPKRCWSTISPAANRRSQASVTLLGRASTVR